MLNMIALKLLMLLIVAQESCSSIPGDGQTGQCGTTRTSNLIKTGFQNGLGVIKFIWFFLAVEKGT